MWIRSRSAAEIMSLYASALSLECLKMYLLIYKLVFSLFCDHLSPFRVDDTWIMLLII